LASALPPATPEPDNPSIKAATQGANGQEALFTDPEPACARIDVTELDARGGVTLPEGVLALDIETADADEMWARGPEFVRLVGYQTGDRIRVSPEPWELAGEIAKARVIVGHKIMGFDLLAYAKEYGIDLVQLATEGRVFDTKLAGILNDPPTPGMNQKQIEREYSLDNMGAGSSARPRPATSRRWRSGSAASTGSPSTPRSTSGT
jgi:hypothetical protein